MNTNKNKQNAKPGTPKNSAIPGKKCTPKANTMSSIAKLMATFYGIEQN
jgi:hypothetical protein